ncbi:MAG: beta-galactosidase [Clostridiales bacterium]|jgi:beta-galactosidase|nr:beta-galactosidase [Clostridiales bacterium]
MGAYRKKAAEVGGGAAALRDGAPLWRDGAALLHGGDYNPDQWLDRPDILAADIDLMKRAKVNCVSLAIFAWAALEPSEGDYRFDWLEEIIGNLHRNGIFTILATPSGARPAWLARAYPEVLRVGPGLERNLMEGRHNHCYTSPVYREKVWQIDKRLSERFGEHPGVIAWHLSNEYGGECFCPLCQEAFRGWLKEKYGTLTALNAEWWAAFWSHSYSAWEQVEAPSRRGEHNVHGLVLDWKRFVTQKTVEFCAHEKTAVRAGGSTLPVTTNFMSFYEGLNYGKFRNVLDVVSWDSYPEWHRPDMSGARRGALTAFAHDYMRCMHPERAPWLLMESTPSVVNWNGASKLKRPGMHALSSLQAVAHGADSVQYFQWRKGRGGSEKLHGAVVGHDGTADTRVFRDVAEVGQRLAALSAAGLSGSLVRPQAAVIFDQENRWALAEAKGPRNTGTNYPDAVFGHYRALWAQGASADVVDMECPLKDRGYKLIAAPMLYLQRAGIAEKLRAFVEGGGTLVGTYLSGLVNENDLCRLGKTPHGLTDVFGLATEEIDALWDGERNGFAWGGGECEVRELCELVRPTTAETLAAYRADFYAGKPVVLRNRFGKGTAYFIAARPDEAFLAAFYRELMREAGIAAALGGIPGGLPEGVSATLREKDGRAFIFVLNFNETPVTFTLPRPYQDIETGAGLAGQLTLDAYGARVLTEV